MAAEYGYSKMEDLYAALGYGKFSARQVLGKIAPGAVKDDEDGKAARRGRSGTDRAAGGRPRPARTSMAPTSSRCAALDDLLVYRAKCCNPIRGEAIVGYVTRGKGVAVHSRMCPNVQSLMYDVERKIEVEWARAAWRRLPRAHRGPHRRPPGHAQPAHLACFPTRTPTSAAWKPRPRLDHDGGVVEMTVDVRDKKQLEKLVAAMRRISGVRDVERLHS